MKRDEARLSAREEQSTPLRLDVADLTEGHDLLARCEGECELQTISIHV
jgi:hypothetical protein